ncbi:hypothetical protein B0H17DRAFT_1213202 [Mycena rosella]|uniref:Uncharacterized protein n=1 Tax=Mycena rosella TaxID=1033263 RepID=A0AAD7CRC3_MYCRO|nr:hypothetical protein B0H17DRAFT_1213202 [Mycena rosella]
MSSYYGPDESAPEISLERAFVAGDVVTGVGFGAQVALYMHCVLYLWKRRNINRSAIFLLAYITTLLSVEVVFVVVQAKTVQMIYIDNRNYPGGPWAFFLATQNAPVNVIFYATLFVLTFLSDILVLWRCWVIWAADGLTGVAYLVIAFPCIMLLGSFAMGVLWTLESSQPGLSLYSERPMAYGTAYYAISLSVNVVISILIIARLLIYRRRLRTGVPGARASHYLSIATIFVESAALYSVFAILFLITYATDEPTNQIWLSVASAAQEIAGYLIIYRLADGRAWQSDTMRISSVVAAGMQFSLGTGDDM